MRSRAGLSFVDESPEYSEVFDFFADPAAFGTIW
jgi:hypothetical protein